jgi:hypothetical protein
MAIGSRDVGGNLTATSFIEVAWHHRRSESVSGSVGGADLDGSGLRGRADRVAALGARFRVESPAGAGTRLPVKAAPTWPSPGTCASARRRSRPRPRHPHPPRLDRRRDDNRSVLALLGILRG